MKQKVLTLNQKKNLRNDSSPCILNNIVITTRNRFKMWLDNGKQKDQITH